MQLLTIVSLFIVTAFTGAFKPTAWKANQLLRMSTSASNGAFLKFTSSKVKAATAAGLLLAGGLIASPVTPAWAAPDVLSPPLAQSGSFKTIKLPNGVDFGIERGDPNARLVYTCSGNPTDIAQADVTTSVQIKSFAVERSSTSICQSKQVTVSFIDPTNPATKSQVLAIDTSGNWQTNYDGLGHWVIVAAPAPK
jgi:hypothetical protein